MRGDLLARVEMRDGQITQIRLGGNCVEVMRGEIGV